MSNIKEVKFGKRAPIDLSGILRNLADDVDAGRITELVAAYLIDGEYEFAHAASLGDSLVLSTLLHKRVVDRFSEEV